MPPILPKMAHTISSFTTPANKITNVCYAAFVYGSEIGSRKLWISDLRVFELSSRKNMDARAKLQEYFFFYYISKWCSLTEKFHFFPDKLDDKRKFCRINTLYIYLHHFLSFSICFYPKRLTIQSIIVNFDSKWTHYWKNCMSYCTLRCNLYNY